jgi:UDP-galactopyranose mutase
VNHPGAADCDPIRTVEWKHLMLDQERASVRGTVITQEFPFTPTNPNEYEYPFPDEANHRLFQQYAARVKAFPKLIVCGRLGEYRYFDMDQAIGRAMTIADKLLGTRPKKIKMVNGTALNLRARPSGKTLFKRTEEVGI